MSNLNSLCIVPPIKAAIRNKNIKEFIPFNMPFMARGEFAMVEELTVPLIVSNAPAESAIKNSAKPKKKIK